MAMEKRMLQEDRIAKARTVATWQSLLLLRGTSIAIYGGK